MRQAAGEEYSDYLVCVEGLSRDCKFGSSKNVQANEILTTSKQQFCLYLAVIGLRNPVLCMRMIAKTDLS